MQTSGYTIKAKTQQYKIDTHNNIYPLDTRLDVCEWCDAAFQLETYHTLAVPAKKDKQTGTITPAIPSIKIGVIAPVTRTKSYQHGDKVNVISKIPVNIGCTLTNIVKTDFLANIIAKQK